MSNNNHNREFQVEYTGDGSPTLVVKGCEPMHSSDGAASETSYIYQPAIEFALSSEQEPQILSVGLGLGYNEILAFVLATKQSLRNLTVTSHESQAWLVGSFQDWILSKDSENLSLASEVQKTRPQTLFEIYDAILMLFCDESAVSPAEVRKYMKTALNDGDLLIRDALDLESLPFIRPAQAVLFDAYSNKTSPKLWDEDFLQNFVGSVSSGGNCCLATYAATGSLTRALRAHNFELQKKKGFGKKRESTFAIKPV